MNRTKVMATLTNERLEEISSGKGCVPLTVEAQQLADENLSLRTKLAELEKQKPVAWTNADNLFDVSIGHAAHIAPRDENTYRMPLYARPVPQAVSQPTPIQPYTVPDEIDVKDPALDTHRKWMAEGWNRCRATMLQSTGSEPSPMVTVEHRRVIEMLLSVCAAAFEIADDTCNQEVDGEWCHVVPDNSFSRLSDALDNIENSLPSEYAELPNTVLQWATVPRHALRELLQPALNGGTE
ncbi:hypothetical protein IM880_13065 [Pectobacterium polaris]|uniref:Eaa1 n=1 Tax=Pectobacterium polaris TaxID=2042057 RepID=A0AAW4P118_9GAMM|nr:hypothetical protein [Pectobacterium polaris]MBW5893146.1 hypothetical protein [Pectobacterium polaris]